jgi:hypothetical protein
MIRKHSLSTSEQTRMAEVPMQQALLVLSGSRTGRTGEACKMDDGASKTDTAKNLGGLRIFLEFG